MTTDRRRSDHPTYHGGERPRAGDRVRSRASGITATVTDLDHDGWPVLRYDDGSGGRAWSTAGNLELLARDDGPTNYADPHPEISDEKWRSHR